MNISLQRILNISIILSTFVDMWGRFNAATLC